ncbi:MAG: peptidoglycan-binding protein [Alphaproteobacteria bacterium]|nr:peptidoglycan-binding protein [Alphaproteobacteria bacterium]
MRTLILATVSAIALGIAGAGPLYAQNTNNSPAPLNANNSPVGAPPPSAAPPAAAAPAQPTMPEENANTNANTNTEQMPPAMGGNEQANQYSQQESRSAGEWSGRLSRDEIKQIQSNLKQDGLYRGNVDGIDGPETHQALRAYQQQNGLSVTGRPDQQTVASLLGTGNATGSSTPPNNSTNNSNSMNMPPSSNAGSNGAGNGSSPNNNQP